MARRVSGQRVLRTAVIGAGVLLSAAMAWAVYQMRHHPRVELAEPTWVVRSPSDEKRITLLFGGDFAPADAAMESIRRGGYHYPYLGTAQLMQEADVALANLEAPVTASTTQVWYWKPYSYRVDPVATEAWKWLGLDMVSLANNHVLDYRALGLTDTIAHLERAGIAHIGGGGDASLARKPVIFKIGETRIGFLAYLENQIGFNLGERLFARPGRAGCAQLNRDDAREDVRRLRRFADLVVVSVHWGDNYSEVTDGQRAYADYLAELGVDLVVGHHPHNEQSVAVRGRTVILYSLGNYAWGAPGRATLRIGLLARARVQPRDGATPAHVAELELFPIVTQNRIVGFQPRRVSQAERDWLNPLIAASQTEGTRLSLEDDEDGPRIRVELGNSGSGP